MKREEDLEQEQQPLPKIGIGQRIIVGIAMSYLIGITIIFLPLFYLLDLIEWKLTGKKPYGWE